MLPPVFPYVRWCTITVLLLPSFIRCDGYHCRYVPVTALLHSPIPLPRWSVLPADGSVVWNRWALVILVVLFIRSVRCYRFLTVAAVPVLRYGYCTGLYVVYYICSPAMGTRCTGAVPFCRSIFMLFCFYFHRAIFVRLDCCSFGGGDFPRSLHCSAVEFVTLRAFGLPG